MSILAKTSFLLLAGLAAVHSRPLSDRDSAKSCSLSDTKCGPIPGESELYNNYTGVAPPFPATHRRPINATDPGAAPGADDLLFQNLLSAEWIIYSFYQAGVEMFNQSSFTSLGLPDTTYERIQEIRDNEAGHLRIFQDSISNASIKPGPCKYEYGFDSPAAFLALQQLIEQASETFLTGLAMQAKLNETKGALVAIAAIESRHSAWALIDVWNVNPFTGPAETVFPYANQILDVTNGFVVNGSCPAENPPYPFPSQHLPRMSFNASTTDAKPGSAITFSFGADPAFEDGKDYYAVYFHGVQSISVAFDRSTNSSTIPKQFDSKGIIETVIADEPGAPTLESVVAGPLLIIQQPSNITLLEN